ncbi:hypothetical protein [Lysinibacillus xylanilyticus]|uniref:hypothetical protein n=1 Tax=Lysinibacillus xylanilyticus TaxID=582475 RepID=UPI0036DF0864
MAHKMKNIWKARHLILAGKTVAEVAKSTGMYTSTIYSYTKQERAKVKELRA